MIWVDYAARMDQAKVRIGNTDVTGAGINDAKIQANELCERASGGGVARSFKCGRLMSGRYITFENWKDTTLGSPMMQRPMQLEVKELSRIITCPPS